MVTYTVQPGDTLYRLSMGFGCSVNDVCRTNSISEDQILRVGQTLRIPVGQGGVPPSDCPDSTNTTRACGCNFFETEVSVSRMVFVTERPKAVYLARGDVFGEAVAASALQHFPVDGPLLLTDPNRLPDILAAEIRRLNPTGTVERSQVVVVGSVGEGVLADVRRLGFSVERQAGANMFETAALVAQRRGYPEDIQLISTDPTSGGAVAAGWSAHTGDPILLSERDRLPEATRQAIQNTRNPKVYVIGGRQFISDRVLDELRNLNVTFVDRIAGADPYETSVLFTRYKSPVSDYGWNRNKKEGHAFTFPLLDQWQYLVSSSPYSHMGKHTPFLFVNRNSVPPSVARYIEEVNPRSGERPPFMHGFISGSTCLISEGIQATLHKALSIDMPH
ncbi:MAG: cell wall-binding repeat-containing protein [Firmicutes bacterium]|nr:cell wall-binding repeat-containing protein [Bacillota bacterium]